MSHLKIHTARQFIKACSYKPFDAAKGQNLKMKFYIGHSALIILIIPMSIN
jgi:hypothetical protein